MSNDSAHAERLELKRKMPLQMIIACCIIVPIFLAMVESTIFDTKQYDITALTIFMFGVWYVSSPGTDKGYRLAWDKDCMYMRDWSYRWFLRRHLWHSMRYDEVVLIEGQFKGNAAMKAAFMPFEYIIAYNATYDDKQAIWIHPPSFHDSEVKAFLKHLASKRPDLVPQDIIDFSNSDQPL
jgi:hypothetical protein